MIIRLKRFSYAPTETEGVLCFADGLELATIEQPWVPNPGGAFGGLPFKSCVPDGMYNLLPYSSLQHPESYILYNPELGVNRRPEDHPPGEERDRCLIHVANFVTDVQGCIGVGARRALLVKHGHAQRAVAASKYAMNKLRDQLGRKHQHILSIENVTGASDQ